MKDLTSEFLERVDQCLEEGTLKYGDTYLRTDQIPFIREKLERYASIAEKGNNPDDLVKIAALCCLGYMKFLQPSPCPLFIGFGSFTGESGRALKEQGVLNHYYHYRDKFKGWYSLPVDAVYLSIGYKWKIPAEITGRLEIYNLHPGTLPLFKGKDPHVQALNLGVRATHVTIHRVMPEIDAGMSMLTLPVFISDYDDEESLLKKLKVKGLLAVRLFTEAYREGYYA
jgi:hypothetical protein